MTKKNRLKGNNCDFCSACMLGTMQLGLDSYGLNEMKVKIENKNSHSQSASQVNRNEGEQINA
jgi:hypothetical protein